MFKCEVNDIYNSATKIINEMKINNESIIFSIAIDGTKVPQNLSVSSTHKCMMGGTYPNHMMNTVNLGKECIFKILENKKEKIDLAQEVKVATMCMQNQKKGLSPMAIIAARPQGVNQA